MTQPRAIALAVTVVVAAITFAVSGCVQQPAPVVPTSTPTVAPVFKSDAEALAAARAAYLLYLQRSDEIAHDGWKDATTISALDTPKQLQRDLRSIEAIRASGDHTRGSTSLANFTLQQLDNLTGSRVRIEAYACVNVSNTRLLSATGSDITPTSRPSVTPLVVTFLNSEPRSQHLLLDGSSVWQGKNFC